MGQERVTNPEERLRGRLPNGELARSLLDCEQSLFFFRFSEGSAGERERRAARKEGTFRHARGHLRISHVLLDGPRIKRDCS